MLSIQAPPWWPLLTGDQGTWAESYTKLLAFNQTQYARVLQLDSDSIILQVCLWIINNGRPLADPVRQTMDELFFLPPVPLAIPRAYWLNHRDNILSSQLLLIQPSNFEFARISKAIDAAGSKEYDMEIVNKLYKDSALILPHRPYNMLTTEYRYKNHKDYMGNEEEPFDPERVLKECKFLHFSDWPMPKVKASDQLLRTKVLTYS